MAARNRALNVAGWVVILVTIGLGCSGTPTNACNSNSLGASTSVDACASGGAQSNGGNTSFGDTANTGGLATGGLPSMGGAQTTGGTVHTEGTLASGGSGTGGGAMGGAPNTSGTTSTGGLATGGLPPTGGTMSTGGLGTGGLTLTGGTRPTGGSSATGGTGDPYGCGDGVEFRFANGDQTYSEICDDGNAVSGDGCEPDCVMTPNPYVYHHTLQYSGSWGGYDDELGLSLAADRDWLVVGAMPGGGAFVPEDRRKTNMPTILIYRFEVGSPTGSKYVEVSEIRANEWTTWPATGEPNIGISNGLIAWNKIKYGDALGTEQTGAMILEWTGTKWQKKFGVPYPSTIDKCPISSTGCASRWPSDLGLNRGRLIISDEVGDVTVPQGQPDAGSYRTAGRVFIFRVDGTEPMLEASLYDVSTTYFGSKVAIYDDVAAVSSKDKVNLYRRVGTTWQLEQVLPCEGGGKLERDLFVTAASCGVSASPVGAVNVFRHVKGGWRHEQTILPIDFKPDLRFGRSIAVSGNRIVIGAAGYGVNDGAAYAYTYEPNRFPAWQGVQLLRGNPTQRNSSGTITHVGEEVGYSVAAIGRAMIVGQPTSRLLTDKYQKVGKVHVYMDCPFASGCPLGVCNASAQACDGSIATRCDEEGLAFVEGGINCHASDQVCSAGTCVSPVCDFGASRCTGNRPERCAPDQLGWRSVDACTADKYCEDGTGFWPVGCRTPACTPGSPACVREVAGICASNGGELEPGSTNCRASGRVCHQGSCVSPLFYDGFENGLQSSDWTELNVGTSSPKTVTGGALETGNALACVACELSHAFTTRVQPGYIGFWARTAQVRFRGMAKGNGSEVFGVDLDTIDTHQSITLENGTSYRPAVARWPSVRTTDWSLVEFKDIDWTARTFDFYYNGDLLRGGVPMGNGAGLDSIEFRFSNWLGFEQLIDEVVVR